MRRRVILRLRRESAVIAGSAAVIWLLLWSSTVDGHRIATGPATAAILAPMLVAALYYGGEARRLARRARRGPAARRLLWICRSACAALLLASAADLLWRWGRLDPTVAVATAIITATAALTYIGYFHRRVARADPKGLRLARTSMHRTLAVKA